MQNTTSQQSHHPINLAHKLVLITSVILLAAAPITIMGQPLQQFLQQSYHNHKDTLPYRLRYPKDYQPQQKYPLIVFLHGNGERGNDNQKQLAAMPTALTDSIGSSRFPCFILAPQCSKSNVWVKFPNFPNSLSATTAPTTPAALTLALVKKLQNRLPIDPKRIYLTGYSAGGEGTLDLLARAPKVFAAAIAICPVADTTKAKQISHKPIWIFHGAQDRINLITYSELEIEAIQKHQGRPRFTRYEDLGHNIWKTAYQEATLFPWLFQQKQNR